LAAAVGVSAWFFRKKEIEHRLVEGKRTLWDVSSVENMLMMCYGNKYFNNGTLGLWDVSSVTNMNQCFAKSGFVSDISRWNVSNVVDMYGIFQDSNFNIDISGWDVRKVIVWEDAFLNCPLGAPGNVNLLPPKFH